MKKLAQYTTILETITTCVNSALASRSEKQKRNDQPRAFCFMLALKTNNSLNTVNLLLLNVPTSPHFCDSIFLLLRTMLSDAITYYYLLSKSYNAPNEEEVLAEEIKILDSDHIRYLYNNLKVYQKLYGDSDKSIGKKESTIKKNYPEYFNADGSIKYRLPTISKMVLAINETQFQPVISLVINAFELYDRFSKLEHLGAFTTQLITRQNYEENHNEIFREIYLAVKTILTTLNSLLMPILNTEEIEQFQQMVGELKAIKIYE